jgi:hypothetical protein
MGDGFRVSIASREDSWREGMVSLLITYGSVRFLPRDIN